LDEIKLFKIVDMGEDYQIFFPSRWLSLKVVDLALSIISHMKLV